MKIKEGFNSRTIAGEFIVVPSGRQRVDFNKVISMNGTAAYLWQKLEGKEFTIEDMAALLLEEYDVTPEKAAADSQDLAAKWQEAGLLD